MVKENRVFSLLHKGDWKEDMSDQNWYVYQNSQQLGPFGEEQISQMLSTNMISQEAYLFKTGWKDWRPLEDCREEFPEASEVSLPPDPAKIDERRQAAPRASISGRVIVHNDGQLVIGSGVNISSTGIFVETKDQIFTVGEKLKLSIKADSFTKAFNAVALVVRFNSDPKLPLGYGLRFEDLDAVISKEIQQAVDAENAKNGRDDKQQAQ